MRGARTIALAFAYALSGCHKTAPQVSAAPPAPPEWTLLASELPEALLSVSGRSKDDVFAVGADKGHGPLVLHFQRGKWSELHTGTSGDLWWVQALPSGPVLMAGAHATVLRFDPALGRFERLKTPGTEGQTVYGVWGTDAGDFYAVGSAGGKNGFVWHFHAGAFESESLPADLPRSGASAPGFFKVFGAGGEVWVVGTEGTLLHRRGASPFSVVPTGTHATLFTAHGAGDRLLAVGGGGNGVLLEVSGGAVRDLSPPSAGLIQGVFATVDRGDWASGERGTVYARPPGAKAFAAVDHGLELPPSSSLHSIFVDESGGVWSAGGNVLGTALDDGMLVHYGEPVPPVVLDDHDDP